MESEWYVRRIMWMSRSWHDTFHYFWLILVKLNLIFIVIVFRFASFYKASASPYFLIQSKKKKQNIWKWTAFLCFVVWWVSIGFNLARRICFILRYNDCDSSVSLKIDFLLCCRFSTLKEENKTPKTKNLVSTVCVNDFVKQQMFCCVCFVSSAVVVIVIVGLYE